MSKSKVTPFKVRAIKILTLDLVERFLAAKTGANGPATGNTSRAYRNDLRAFVASFDAWEVRGIDASRIVDYLNGLRRDDGKPLAQATKRRHRATLSSFFAWLEAQGLVDKNPIQGNLAKIRLPEPEANDLSLAVQEELVKRAKAVGPREHALIVLLLGTGLRISEALALVHGDLDLAGLRLMVQCGKGGKSRRVPFTPKVARVIRSYIRSKADQGPNEPLFLSSRGQALSYPRAASLFKALAQGLTDDQKRPLHLHQLRHTYATRQLKVMEHPIHLATLTGHSDLRTLRRYAKAAEYDAAEAQFRKTNR